ncbi:hypothetical protein GUITHDRAFT_105504 [Guillardia theta CCMP2712]|uniref:Uncharacterized protein n=1 Tax=Guillardia theta (strain CCMP2712) TaxID=905079 RepID=L1JLA5_GUITC|nr:hypothetical protein GUITHDRAFT_105504 [Guillardia theta CCMP2712]EKX48880.1 hypothetical protein GUITHDRAFT_105504 [Guillardia theta CCMP2712]|eukprot:XP_005835860.1 hypothetical protein GUITHDRAFT_105504 [Guillardia theta CCMP2712]
MPGRIELSGGTRSHSEGRRRLASSAPIVGATLDVSPIGVGDLRRRLLLGRLDKVRGGAVLRHQQHPQQQQPQLQHPRQQQQQQQQQQPPQQRPQPRGPREQRQSGQSSQESEPAPPPRPTLSLTSASERQRQLAIHQFTAGLNLSLIFLLKHKRSSLMADLTDILDTTSLIQAIKRYSSFAGTDHRTKALKLYWTQLLHFEVVTGGITLGGLPIGTDGFHASQLRAKVSTLNEELSKLGLVQHGFMFKTLVRASHLQKLRFFLQGSSPFLPRVQSQIRRFDLSVHLALEKYHRWPSSQYLAAHPDLLEFARFKRELPHSRGGDEFTPSEGLHPAVYYTAIARFLASGLKHPLATFFGFALGLALPRLASRCGLCICRKSYTPFFVEAHDFVHNAGAILYRRVKAPAPAADGAAIPPAPAAVPDDAGRPPASVVHIPGLRALVDSSHEHFIPPPAQRNVTPLVMRVFPRHVHARAALTDQQRDILTLHSRRTHSLKSQDRVLQSTIFAHFPERDLSHSPMRVSSYYPLKAFPHRYAQMLDCYLHGMPICQCPTKCDGCQRELDPSVAAHHLQTCKRRSSKLPTAHDNLTRTIRNKLNRQAHSPQREAAQTHTKHKPEKNQHCHPDAASPAQARSRADKQPKGQAIKQQAAGACRRNKIP